MKQPKILFLVNGPRHGPYGVRARGLVRHFCNVGGNILYRNNRLISLFKFLLYAVTYQCDFIYIINIAFSAAAAGFIAKLLTGKKLIIDAGDINHKLFKIMGVNPALCFLEKLMEERVLSAADIIVVRGRYFKEYLQAKGYKNVYYIPDGVDVSQFYPKDNQRLKNKIAPKGELVVGLVGSLMWSEPLKYCYGSDLIEALNILKAEPVKAVIIGDGNGKKHLKEKAAQYGIADRVVFAGTLPYDNLPEYINVMDLCLSTQLNDITGWVRTPGKLPLYLACGKYIISTDVGDARYVLPDEMRLAYDGLKDAGYPKRLSGAILKILHNKTLLNKADSSRDTAEEEFDYKKLSQRLETIILEHNNV
ncbi:MAG: glycosyltransferase [Candidatus Omnitrophica bacterium]|nr:glycosyltransferase [Candidatus Omnitrophota bacterium]